MRASRFRITPCYLLIAFVGGFAPGTQGVAQTPGESSAHRLAQTRSELEGRLRQLDETTQTAGVQQEGVYIRQRLTDGDFHVGDRVLISVEEPMFTAGDQPSRQGDKTTEEQLSDTFTVNSAQQLALPVVGSVALHGVLRTELEPLLTVEIARYIRDPVVHARSLVGLAVTGELARPGYYSVPADAVLPAVLTSAGGTTHEAKLNKLRIQRNGRTIWEGDALRRAIATGATVDDLGLQPGDVIQVPRGGSLSSVYTPTQLVAVLLGIPVTLYTLTRIF